MADWTPPKLGAPVWLGIAANDVSRAEAFYATVFNWTFTDAPARARKDQDQPAVPPTRLFDFTSHGVSITGGIQHKPEEEKTGTPPAAPGGTLVYWLVEDLGKIAEVIERAGGKMVGSEEPVREGESGVYRYFEDTEGNVGGVYQFLG